MELSVVLFVFRSLWQVLSFLERPSLDTVQQEDMQVGAVYRQPAHVMFEGKICGNSLVRISGRGKFTENAGRYLTLQWTVPLSRVDSCVGTSIDIKGGPVTGISAPI